MCEGDGIEFVCADGMIYIRGELTNTIMDRGAENRRRRSVSRSALCGELHRGSACIMCSFGGKTIRCSDWDGSVNTLGSWEPNVRAYVLLSIFKMRSVTAVKVMVRRV